MSISMVPSDKTARAMAEHRGRRVAALLGALFALLVACACAPAAYAEDKVPDAAANQANTVELKPDGYYNASEATSQTLVRISEPGTYALLGSSSLVRVVVDPDPGDEIRVYLLNGLTLSPSTGAAITVTSSYDSEKQSHVELVLGAGAKVNLSSGSTTALSVVMDPASVMPPSSDPMVTITAQDSRGTLNLKSSTKSGDGAPGLWADGISGVNIAGGTVTATGSGTAPGIGGAHSGSKVMISGGTVYANGSGAAPGIGTDSGPAAISITGGVVYASNDSIDASPLIGSVNGTATVSISGGKTVYDGEYGQLAIGSKANDAQIAISGGTVDVGFASCGSSGDGAAKVQITGGSYTGFTAGTGASAFTAVNRAGATVYRLFVALEGAKAGTTVQSMEISGVNPAYGINDMEASLVQVKTGVEEAGFMLWLPEMGEVTGAIDHQGVCYNGEIHPTKPDSGLDYGMLERDCNLTLDPNTDAGYEGEAAVRYGSSEVIVEEGVEPNEDNLILLGFYDKPEGGTMVMDDQYRLVPGAEGWTNGWGAWDRYDAPYILYAQWRAVPYTIVYDANVPVAASTSVTGSMEPHYVDCGEETALQPLGYALPGYQFMGWNTESDGTGDSYADGEQVVDLAESGNLVTLYAQWTPVRYKVSFDANVPASASTAVSGEMNTQAFVYDASAALPLCAYVLPGYKFVGWSTEPDGGGVVYADGAEVLNLAADSSSIIELYAQWEAIRYSVSLDVEGDVTELEAVFDVPFELPDTVDAPDGRTLMGWEGLSFGSLYAGGATVVNLCTVHKDGSISGNTLRAVLVEDGTFGLVITNNGVGVSLSDASDIVLQDASGTQYKPFEAAGSGLYVAQGMQPGEYSVLIEGWNTEGVSVQVAPDGGGSLALEYFSVQIDAEKHAVAWAEDPASGERGRLVERLRAGDELRIGASVDEGYSFESWTAIGAEPAWENGDSTAAEQVVEVSGQTLLEAHPVANTYHVSFDANGGEGSMEPQDMVYDEPQRLFANTFEREGYEFAGWSIEPEGDTVYADGQRVSNLTTEANGEVTLYAQWNVGLDPGIDPDPDDPDDPTQPEGPEEPDDPDSDVDPDRPGEGSDGSDAPGSDGGSDNQGDSSSHGADANGSGGESSSSADDSSGALARTGDGLMPIVIALVSLALASAAIAACAWGSRAMRH